MPEVRWMTHVIVGTLLSAASLADDAGTRSTEADLPPVTALSFDSLYSAPLYSSRWQLSYPVEPIPYAFDGSQSIGNLDFQDSGAFSRVKKIRALSLLTLAEGKGTRVFFGVDKEGLVGIHFRGLPRDNDDRFFEVVRMPYLEKDQPDDEADDNVN